jgi:hypothetical protein
VTVPDSYDLLWGLVGRLAFLVRVQGHELLFGERVPVTVKIGVALGWDRERGPDTDSSHRVPVIAANGGRDHRYETRRISMTRWLARRPAARNGSA